MKAVASNPLTLASKQAVIGDLTSGFTSALPHGKSRHWAHAISRLAQRFECFGQSKSQRADHACSHNRDAGSDEDAQNAISKLNGHAIEGRQLTVNEARPRESRPPGGGGRGYGGGGYGGRREGGGPRRGH